MRPDAGLALPFHGPKDFTRETRDRVDILSQEMASGRGSDVGRALRSDFSDLSRLSHDLQGLDAVATSLSRAETWGAGLQAALGGIGAAMDGLSDGLSAIPASGADGGLLPVLAEGALRDVAALLNGMSGERALFANGAATGPIGDVEAVLADVRALASGSADYDAYAAAVDAYFAPGGTFEATRLATGPGDPVRFPAGDGKVVAFAVDAGSEEIVQVVAQIALAAGLSDAAFPVAQGSAAVSDLNGRIAAASGDLPTLRGRVGAIEQRIETLSSNVSEDRTRTEMALADTVGIDMFEAASRLQNEMSRLESLYAITARRARLRLTDYL